MKCPVCKGRLVSTKRTEWIKNHERVVYRCNKCGKDFVRWQDNFSIYDGSGSEPQ
jgi:uncharacterized protein with PIN domain